MRNIERCSGSFRFQLPDLEKEELFTNIYSTTLIDKYSELWMTQLRTSHSLKANILLSCNKLPVFTRIFNEDEY